MVSETSVISPDLAVVACVSGATAAASVGPTAGASNWIDQALRAVMA